MLPGSRTLGEENVHRFWLHSASEDRQLSTAPFRKLFSFPVSLLTLSEEFGGVYALWISFSNGFLFLEWWEPRCHFEQLSIFEARMMRLLLPVQLFKKKNVNLQIIWCTSSPFNQFLITLIWVISDNCGSCPLFLRAFLPNERTKHFLNSFRDLNNTP